MDMANMAERLERKYGLGTNPDKSRGVYRTCERLSNGPYADQAYKIVCEVAVEADGKNQPGVWFRKTVMLRFREAGLLPTKPVLQPR